MKTRLSVMVMTLIIFALTGCKKDSFNPLSKSHDDFIGTWKGTITTFKNNKLLKENGEMVVYRSVDGVKLEGILFMNETRSFHEFQFLNGTLYFKVNCPSPDDPFCQNWSLGGYASFSSETQIDLRITGNECGSVGNEYVDWSGTLTYTIVPADSVSYFHFAKPGNTWTYKTWLKNGDSCQVQKQIMENPGTYAFAGISAQTCGWPNPNMSMRWNVTPVLFSIINDSTITKFSYNFPLTAKLNTTYRTVIGADTVTVTLTDTNVYVGTGAGAFRCFQFRCTEPESDSLQTITRISDIWIDKRFGLIRQQVINTLDPAGILFMELTGKNF